MSNNQNQMDTTKEENPHKIEEEDKQCRDCEIEAKKHCDECGGYGSEEEEEKRDWWGASDGIITIKYETQEYMEMNFDEYGGFIELIDCREEDK